MNARRCTAKKEARMAMEWTKLLNRERPRKSTNPGDHRAEFERDYDRAVFSTPVKRLQDKAQVFPLDPNDAVRTRLTHSLEVSSVARGIAIKVAHWLLEQKAIQPGMDRWIEAIAATCGLIHDLGNPPFGHSGEDAIRHWFKTRFKAAQLSSMMNGNQQLINDFLLFEGNAQSLRLLARLQILADFNGLNMTFGTLSAASKYVAASDEINSQNHSFTKPGHFASENDLVKQIREYTGTGQARNPITFLVEGADDIVYSVADVEDGIKKGILSWNDLQGFLEEEMKASPGILKKVLEGKDTILKAGRLEVPTDLPSDVHGTAFRTAAIGVVVYAVVETFKAKYNDIMNGRFTGELVNFEGQEHPLVTALKKLGREKIYCTPPTLKLELMGRRVICDLLDVFWEGAKEFPLTGKPKAKTFAGKIGRLLSENYTKVFQSAVVEQPNLPEVYHRLRLITDYVCGMTDTFAKRLHAELTNG